ncbi:MAG TPA: VOC family protein [Allocoleopsis sp.]
MTFEFDHLFICTDVAAEKADRLVSLGIVEGSSNQHPGQGTANRRFFFHNAMVEFLWVHDPIAAQSEAVRRTRLWERWCEHTSVSQRRRDHVCPFGICLRPGHGSGGAIAFPSWEYRPPYLPASLSIAVGNNSEELAEPMLFQIPFGKRPDQSPPEKAQPLEHPIGLREITRVEVVTPVATCPRANAYVSSQLAGGGRNLRQNLG